MRYFIVILLCFLMSADLLSQTPPQPRREFRAAWVATVANIDWPSKPGMSVPQMQNELNALLDKAEALNLNAIVFQVRPACDALYRSPLEPWSEFLTGEQGQAPAEGFDPLAFAIEGAHRRGIELHVWFNPFRASHPSGRGRFAPSHVSRKHPEWVVDYGKYKWLNPGIPAARDHSVRVIADVAERYDVDGVHLDDYFYPYPVKDDAGDAVEFPDSDAYQEFVEKRNGNPKISKNDWRRQNVNRFISQLSDQVRKTKPWVRFGVSPFGIYRPGTPPGIQGFDPYENLYADSRLWLREGWVDYMAPQLYWPIDQRPQSFPVLLDWWRSENKQGRHIWPGLYTSRLPATPEAKGWQASEVLRQIELTRVGDKSPGHIHFSMVSLMQNRDSILVKLGEDSYKEPALAPALNRYTLQPSKLTQEDLRYVENAKGIVLSVASFDEQKDRGFLVQWQENGEWHQLFVDKSSNQWITNRQEKPSNPTIYLSRVSLTFDVGSPMQVILGGAIEHEDRPLQ